MKLLNYTTTYFAFLLLLIITVWALIFYWQMLDEIYDSMDDGLENQKMLVIQKAIKDPSILQKTNFDDGYYTFRKVTKSDKILSHRDQYRDTTMYMLNEDDFEPVRLLESIFRHEDEYYKVKVITSMVEEDDLIEDLFYSILWLYIGMVVSILLLNNFLLKKVWHPFYDLLRKLKNFNIESDQEIHYAETNIEEFKLLNKNVDRLLKKSRESYVNQKQFIENASHELQTPLAISINKLELLLESEHLNEKDISLLADGIQNLERLSKFNKSLLLLSKIENRQFENIETLNINQVLQEIIDSLEDLADLRKINIEFEQQQQLLFEGNKELIFILYVNLIKNAIIHSSKNNRIYINVAQNEVVIQNEGEHSLNTAVIFQRFYKKSGVKSSTGIGLALAKAIADKYELGLHYQFREGHLFITKFPVNLKNS
ncbi:sensor histidine kinase [Zunongwangia profunda]|uniref:histidine kinase n=1 Tax=Zunongwangia profunda TaxID=398743 RepID=A0A3D5IUW2_9FLAO|nr:HAMP domain-containing sensor histidine kinase [Zunongwangia profunda]MAS72739.1 two-component sensor histidine kinase [Zunongwangia sp.]HCV79611.1 sensor histidine kinase [Zunongwangia profunda]|tara:strand:- start:2549 stop:3832 length:1284 start_codon:yes stop_codon:yes gene_type:complete